MEEQWGAAGLMPSWREWKEKAKKGLTGHLFFGAEVQQ